MHEAAQDHERDKALSEREEKLGIVTEGRQADQMISGI